MLDNLSDGRLEVGVGRGVSPIELGFFGIEPDTARAVFQEFLDIILQGLSTDCLTYRGQFRSYDKVPIVLSPQQLPRPPIWYPTSHLQSVPWVAENGFNTVFLGSPDHVAKQVDLYRAHAPSSTRQEAKVGILRYLYVAETDREAIKLAATAYAEHLTRLRHLATVRHSTNPAAVPDTIGSDQGNPETIQEAVKQGWAAVGSPTTVHEQLEQMRDQTRCNYLVFNALLGNTTGERGVAMVELFGEAVMPRMQD